jgi:hypothetical protein
MVVMKKVEDERLLKLKGTNDHATNSTYLSHHDEGTFPYSLVWPDITGHINYDSLCFLKNNGVSSLPNILWNLK